MKSFHQFIMTPVMDAVKKQMEMMGWKEGEGLGKNKQGIKKALQPRKKLCRKGLGKKTNDYKDLWWEKLYEQTLNKVPKI